MLLAEGLHSRLYVNQLLLCLLLFSATLDLTSLLLQRPAPFALLAATPPAAAAALAPRLLSTSPGAFLDRPRWLAVWAGTAALLAVISALFSPPHSALAFAEVFRVPAVACPCSLSRPSPFYERSRSAVFSVRGRIICWSCFAEMLEVPPAACDIGVASIAIWASPQSLAFPSMKADFSTGQRLPFFRSHLRC